MSGIVHDVGGTAISHASVRAVLDGNLENPEQLSPAVETDDAGKYSLWVRSGEVVVSVVAEGYVSNVASGVAPGKIDLALELASSFVGSVIDVRTRRPVSKAVVEIAGRPNNMDVTDEEGRFEIRGLAPGHYALVTHSKHGYGRSEGTLSLSRSERQIGIVLSSYPAFVIAGRVVEPDDARTTCKHSSLQLRQFKSSNVWFATPQADGTLQVDGVIPGVYDVLPDCAEFVRRDRYQAISVTNSDVTDIEWQMSAGATLQGRVLDKSGLPVNGAVVVARLTSEDASEHSTFAKNITSSNGAYRFSALRPGLYNVDIVSRQGAAQNGGWNVKVSVPSNRKDFVLDNVGKISGIVVDSAGDPVGNVEVAAHSKIGEFHSEFLGVSAEDGTFTLDGIVPGDHVMFISEGPKMVTSNLTAGELAHGETRVTVVAGRTAHVRLVTRRPSSSIRGVCTDVNGKPVSDAYVFAVPALTEFASMNSNGFAERQRLLNTPALSGKDGSFEISGLYPGSYSLRAERENGEQTILNEAPVEVPVSLVFKPLARISGVVASLGVPPDEFEISLREQKSGKTRNEVYYKTSGRFTVRDLFPGHWTLRFSANGSFRNLELDLADGESRSGVDVQLNPLVTVTGRIVEYGTGIPVAGIYVMASMGESGGFSTGVGGSRKSNVSDENGRFSLENSPTGSVQFFGFPKDDLSEFSTLAFIEHIDGGNSNDVGDVGILRRRLPRDGVAGELGVHWATQPSSTKPDQQSFEVFSIDPRGPAVDIGLKIGDVVTTVDGINVDGDHHERGNTLMHAGPGTRLVLGLRRGAEVSVVLGDPPPAYVEPP